MGKGRHPRRPVLKDFHGILTGVPTFTSAADAVTPMETRILIYAPTGQDAPLAAKVLAMAHIDSHVCATLAELAQQLELGVGAVLTVEEALAPGAYQLLQGLRHAAARLVRPADPAADASWRRFADGAPARWPGWAT
jgi:hypothetical protein